MCVRLGASPAMQCMPLVARDAAGLHHVKTPPVVLLMRHSAVLHISLCCCSLLTTAWWATCSRSCLSWRQPFARSRQPLQHNSHMRTCHTRSSSYVPAMHPAGSSMYTLHRTAKAHGGSCAVFWHVMDSHAHASCMMPCVVFGGASSGSILLCKQHAPMSFLYHTV